MTQQLVKLEEKTGVRRELIALGRFEEFPSANAIVVLQLATRLDLPSFITIIIWPKFTRLTPSCSDVTVKPRYSHESFSSSPQRVLQPLESQILHAAAPWGIFLTRPENTSSAVLHIEEPSGLVSWLTHVLTPICCQIPQSNLPRRVSWPEAVLFCLSTNKLTASGTCKATVCCKTQRRPVQRSICTAWRK